MINYSFYCRQNKANKQGLSPIEVVFVINKERTTLSLDMRANPKTFAKDINKRTPIADYVATMRTKINTAIAEMISADMNITPTSLKEYIKQGKKVYIIKDMVNDYMDIINKRYNTNEMSFVTYSKYRRLCKHIINFFGEDTAVNSVNVGDIESYHAYLKTQFEPSTASSLLTLTKSFFLFAFNNGKIKVNPFATVKIKKVVKEVEYLTQEELDTIQAKTFVSDRLNQVRDVFIFACNTGLAFIDMSQLSEDDIQQHDGVYYVKKGRQKTSVTFTTVLNDTAMTILTKYDYKLPILSNQKYNAYLKEIADICGISKPLHSHIARHTFATIALNKGYNIEIVAKMLGHTNTKQTQHYAKLLDTTVINEYVKIG